MVASAVLSLALLPVLALGDHHWHNHLFDHSFVQVPFEVVEEIKERVDTAKEHVQDRVFGCQPTSTVVHGTTVVHQTVTSPPPYVTPSGYPDVQIAGLSTIDKWATLLTWEHQGTTTLALPCYTAAGHHHGHHKNPEWAVFSKRIPDGDITIRNAFVPTKTLGHQPTSTHSYSPSHAYTVVEKPSTVTVTRIVDHHDVVTQTVDHHHTSTVKVREIDTVFAKPVTTTVTQIVDHHDVVTRTVDHHHTSTVKVWDIETVFAKPVITTVTRTVNHHDVITRTVDHHHTSTVKVREIETVFVKPVTTTVTVAIRPTPTPYQRYTRCLESYTVEGWNYVVFENAAQIIVDNPFESVITISGVFAPIAKFHVRIDGKDLGWTSEPRGGEVHACSAQDLGEKCIVVCVAVRLSFHLSDLSSL
ncbi:uncharacterized protein EI90DRAFT_937057 [Cantharellus anzutake]|uniref:uncharacterized protein n=1 Tax=Cantharellus anzutake TaxID=1750568 RepID=UPI001904AC60|nr:uncharacterized protein EI90DRAFT_937057 [Cantharellus anzutake]KAF8311678.1 hypothetical protein EI90DRAFT_937057 [Cantharellus anzutake]